MAPKRLKMYNLPYKYGTRIQHHRMKAQSSPINKISLYMTASSLKVHV